MADDNKINFSDILDFGELFEDLGEGIDKLMKKSQDLGKTIRGEAKETSDSLKGVSAATEEGTEKIKEKTKVTNELSAADERNNKLLRDAEILKAKNTEATRRANEEAKLEAKYAAATAGSLESLTLKYKSQMQTLSRMTKEQIRNSKEGQRLVQSTADLKEEMEGLKDELHDVEDATKETGSSLGNIPGPIGQVIQGIKGMGTALKALLTNPVVLVIVLVVGLIMGLVSALKRTVEGQDRLNRVMRTGEAVFRAVMDILAELALVIVDVLIKSFKQMGGSFEVIFNSMKIGVLQVRIAFLKLFGKDTKADELVAELKTVQAETKKLKDENKKLGDEMDVTLDKLISKWKGLGDKIKDNVKSAQELADLQKAFVLEELSYIVANAKLQSAADDERAKSEENRRASALVSLGHLEKSYNLRQQILDNEISLAKNLAAQAKINLGMEEDNLDLLRAQAQAEADVIRLTGEKSALETERYRQMNRVRTQALTQAKKRADAEIATTRAKNGALIRANEELIAAENANWKLRTKAAEENARLAEIQAEAVYKAERTVLEGEMAIDLVNAEDYQQRIERLDADFADRRLKAEEDLAKQSHEIKVQELNRRAAVHKDMIDRKLEFIELDYEIEELSIDLLNASNAKKDVLYLKSDIERMRRRIEIKKEELKRLGQLNDEELIIMELQMANLEKLLGKAKGKLDFWDMIGIDMDDEMREGITSAFDFALGQMQEFLDAKIRMAEEAVKATEREMDATQRMLDYELTARANGYASNVEHARKERALAEEQNRAAIAEKKKLQKAQEKIQAAQQTASLITATALIWSQLGNPLLAIPAIGVMWGSFAAAKIQAAKASKGSEEYGDGHVELLSGGSHASGNDIDLGMKADGTRRRAEGGEFFAVINKRSSKRFGKQIPGVINALNDGSFPDRYANVFSGGGSLVLNQSQAQFNLDRIEGDLRDIRDNSSKRKYIDSKGNVIEEYKNLKRVIKS